MVIREPPIRLWVCAPRLLYGIVLRPKGVHSGRWTRTFVVEFIGEEGESFVASSKHVVVAHTSPTRRTPFVVEFGNTYASPHASVIPIPELFTYALYFVIAIVLEVLYLAIPLLFVLHSLSCWCTWVNLVYLGCVIDKLNTKFYSAFIKPKL